MATVKKRRTSEVDDWLEEDKLMLLECWSRDGYTFKDIANRIGIQPQSLGKWRKEYPEINDALKVGREIPDYRVENALLKSALGYRTKESKVTIITNNRNGDVVETARETTTKDVAPNVAACQVWLYNRCPDKWKKNRDNLIDLTEEDSNIQVTVTRADKSQGIQNNNGSNPDDVSTSESNEEDTEWEDEINSSITIGKNPDYDKDKKKRKQRDATLDVPKHANSNIKSSTKVTNDETDLDYWPDDWSE